MSQKKIYEQTGNKHLIGYLRGLMEKEKGVSFFRFMKESLFHSQYGYYASARIGREGDFYTNVSVGKLFGALMAQQFSEMWEALGKPERFDICEQGAHDARFAADVLQFLRLTCPKCFQACHYTIIEPVEDLRERQRDFLRQTGFGERVQWVQHLHEIKTESLTGVFFSNELVDSFPVHRITFLEGKWHESFVTWNEIGGKFEFLLRSIKDTALKEAVRRLAPPAIEGYVTEINLQIKEWIRQVARVLSQGFVLTIDYGFLKDEFYHFERIDGTLRCYHQHKVSNDPLGYVGEQDMTAHVHFSDVIDEGMAAGLLPVGFTDQHHFLVGIAGNSLFQNLDAKSLRAFRTLMHPEMMGAAFKVLIQQKGLEHEFELSGMKYVRPF